MKSLSEQEKKFPTTSGAIRLRLLFILLVMPILLGSVCASYEILMFRSFHFNPEIQPLAVWPASLITALLGGVLAVWSLAAVTRGSVVSKTKERPFQHRSLGNWVATAILALVCFCYVLIRILVVDTELVMQFGYCCCCMDHPELVHTVNRVLNPASLY